jgi:enamine deaminase RidA (YjgF/YER057c/UK114 family)
MSSNLEKKRYSDGAPWEDVFGYCRAIRVGNLIEISGTVSIENGQLVGHDDAGLQTRVILEKIRSALHYFGAELENVIRTRVYVVNMNEWEQVAKVHCEYFGQIKPATSLLEIKRFIAPGYLVEIEATAWVE